MKSVSPSVLTVNGGPSSIRCAIYEVGEPPRRRLPGKIDRICLSGTSLTAHGQAGQPVVSRLTRGRVILAYLGSGAGLAAVRCGKSVDTSMGFTPTAGLLMSTCSGDLDPRLLYYLARAEFRRMAARSRLESYAAHSGLAR